MSRAFGYFFLLYVPLIRSDFPCFFLDSTGDWVPVVSNMGVLHLIIKLHVRIAENYRLLNRTEKCIKSYEDAYTVRAGRNRCAFSSLKLAFSHRAFS